MFVILKCTQNPVLPISLYLQQWRHLVDNFGAISFFYWVGDANQHRYMRAILNRSSEAEDWCGCTKGRWRFGTLGPSPRCQSVIDLSYSAWTFPLQWIMNLCPIFGLYWVALMWYIMFPWMPSCHPPHPDPTLTKVYEDVNEKILLENCFY